MTYDYRPPMSVAAMRSERTGKPILRKHGRQWFCRDYGGLQSYVGAGHSLAMAYENWAHGKSLQRT